MFEKTRVFKRRKINEHIMSHNHSKQMQPQMCNKKNWKLQNTEKYNELLW